MLEFWYLKADCMCMCVHAHWCICVLIGKEYGKRTGDHKREDHFQNCFSYSRWNIFEKTVQIAVGSWFILCTFLFKFYL